MRTHANHGDEAASPDRRKADAGDAIAAVGRRRQSLAATGYSTPGSIVNIVVVTTHWALRHRAHDRGAVGRHRAFAQRRRRMGAR
jgi:hypothetical protein